MARVKKLKSGKLHFEFDSVPDVFRAIKKMDWTPKNEMASDRKGKEGNFYVFGSLAEANDIFLNHPERIRTFSQNDEKLVNIESPGKDVIYDVTGDFLDIDRHLEGIPEVFGNAVMGNPKSVFATINILNSAVCYTTPEYMLEKQKRILRLVDWLETQDIRCQIVLTEDSTINYSSIVVKEFSDHFDLNHLAVAMHPDFFRRTTFLLMEQSPTWSYGYGSSASYDSKMLKYKPKPEDGLYIYVGGYEPYGGKDNGKVELNKAFDKIEEGIEKMIDEGMSFNDEAFTVGKPSRW